MADQSHSTDWADELAREIIDEITPRFSRDTAMEIVAGRLRDAHRAGKLEMIGGE
jgi:hypothetical protein